MSFAFNPKTDAEIDAIQNRALLPDGIYPFTVKDFEQKISKSGNEMLQVRLGVIDKDGSERNIIDYLVATDQMMFKLKHFCDTIGFEKEYAKGQFEPSKCVGRSGKATIGIQKGGAKMDGSGYYADKNNIKDYVKSDEKQKLPADVDLNDDITF